MKKGYFAALMYGWVVILCLIFTTSIFLALIIRFTEITEPIISIVTLIIGLIALFIGGIFSGAKGKGKGWLVGGITGIGFTLLVFLVQYLGYNQTFTLQQSIYHLGYICAASIGGIVGVNLNMSQNN